MKCLILAAGYATRLYPLTKTFPKPLLDVNGKTILDWLVDDVYLSGITEDFVIISNNKFYNEFVNWKNNKNINARITIINDGSTDNSNRFGAVKDIEFAIQKLNLNDDLLVLAGDNVLDFSIKDFYNYFIKKQTTCVMRYFEKSIEKLKRTGVASIDKNERVVSMVEKPNIPASNWAVPPFYIYKKCDLPMIIEGIKDNNCNTDAPGDFIAWLCTKCDVHAYEMAGKRYDIGNLESYEQVKKVYKGISLSNSRK